MIRKGKKIAERRKNVQMEENVKDNIPLSSSPELNNNGTVQEYNTCKNMREEKIL